MRPFFKSIFQIVDRKTRPANKLKMIFDFESNSDFGNWFILLENFSISQFNDFVLLFPNSNFTNSFEAIRQAKHYFRQYERTTNSKTWS